MATKMSEIVEFEIISGPNRWDVVLEGLSKGSQLLFSVGFNIRDKSTWRLIKGRVVDLKFTILGLHRRSFDWVIFGACKDSFNIRKTFNLLDIKISLSKEDPIFFIGEYSTQTRKGEIKFILPTPFGDPESFIPSYISNIFQS